VIKLQRRWADPVLGLQVVHANRISLLERAAFMKGRYWHRGLTAVSVLPASARDEHKRLPISEQLSEFRILEVERFGQDGDGCADQVLRVDFPKRPLAEVLKGSRTRLQGRGFTWL
jgi:hypothetical protein